MLDHNAGIQYGALWVLLVTILIVVGPLVATAVWGVRQIVSVARVLVTGILTTQERITDSEANQVEEMERMRLSIDGGFRRVESQLVELGKRGGLRCNGGPHA